MTPHIKGIFGIILSENKKEVLLIKRRDVPVWVLPGGGVEKSETPEEATLRELKEETGLTVSIHRRVATYLPSPPFIDYTNLYECTLLSGHPKPGCEVADVGFFPLDKLSKLPIPPPFLDFIQDTLKNLPPMERLISLSPFLLAKLLFQHPILSLRFLLSRLGLHINTRK